MKACFQIAECSLSSAKIRTLSIFLYTSNSERITSSAEAIPLSVVTCPAIGTTVTRHPAAAGLAMGSEKSMGLANLVAKQISFR